MRAVSVSFTWDDNALETRSGDSVNSISSLDQGGPSPRVMYVLAFANVLMSANEQRECLEYGAACSL